VHFDEPVLATGGSSAVETPVQVPLGTLMVGIIEVRTGDDGKYTVMIRGCRSCDSEKDPLPITTAAFECLSMLTAPVPRDVRERMVNALSKGNVKPTGPIGVPAPAPAPAPATSAAPPEQPEPAQPGKKTQKRKPKAAPKRQPKTKSKTDRRRSPRKKVTSRLSPAFYSNLPLNFALALVGRDTCTCPCTCSGRFADEDEKAPANDYRCRQLYRWEG